MSRYITLTAEQAQIVDKALKMSWPHDLWLTPDIKNETLDIFGMAQRIMYHALHPSQEKPNDR